VSGELPDSVGELGWLDDRHWSSERNASNRHGEPAEIFAADLDKTAVPFHLDRCVVDPSEHTLELGERGLDGELRVVVTGCRAE